MKCYLHHQLRWQLVFLIISIPISKKETTNQTLRSLPMALAIVRAFTTFIKPYLSFTYPYSFLDNCNLAVSRTAAGTACSWLKTFLLYQFWSIIVWIAFTNPRLICSIPCLSREIPNQLNWRKSHCLWWIDGAGHC